MIISASRRTDIPAFYSDWFFQRLDEGCFFVRNPMNPRQVSRVSFTKEEIEGIVFWTKNPKNLMPKLNRLDPYLTTSSSRLPRTAETSSPVWTKTRL